MLMKLIILPPAPEEALGEQPRPSTLKQRPPPGTLGKETDPGRNHWVAAGVARVERGE